MPAPKKNPSRTPAKPAGAAIAPSIRVLRQFRIVFNAVKSHFRQMESVAGVGGAQIWALSVIANQPGISVGELARALDVHQSTASNLVKSLLERNMVSAEKNQADRRGVALTVLKAGNTALSKAPAPFAGILPDALDGLDPSTLARLEQDLDILIGALAIDDKAANTPLADLLDD